MAGENCEHKPQFFKILMDGFAEKMSIPPLFTHRYLSKEIRDYATIMSPLHRFWHIRIRRDVQHLYFDDGWGEFCKDHDLQKGSFLVFRYEGNSVFSLKIFDLNGCLKKYNVTNNRLQGHTVNQKENGGAQNVSQNHDMLEISHCVSKKKNIRDLDYDDIDIKPTSEMLQNLLKKPTQKSLSVEDKNLAKDVVQSSLRNEKLTEGLVPKSPQIKDKNLSEDLLIVKSHEAKNKELEKDLVLPRSLQNENLAKDHFLPHPLQNENLARNLIQPRSLQNENLAKEVVPPCSLQNENLEKDLVPTRSLQNEKFVRQVLNKSLVRQDLMQGESLQVENENLGEHVVQQKSRVQKKEVTNELKGRISPRFEHNNVIEPTCSNFQTKYELNPAPQLAAKGNSTQSTSGCVKQPTNIRNDPLHHMTKSRPMFETIVRELNIKKSLITVPLKFCSPLGWREKQMIILLDEKRRSWKVNFALYSQKGVFHEGWSQFCIANNVKHGDTCIFELIDKRTMSVVVKHTSKVSPLPERPTLRVSKSMFEKIVKGWNIITNQICIPLAFATPNGWKNKQMLNLQDSKGRSWNVQFSSYGRKGYLTEEWCHFCMANNVESGDKCVFRLIGKETMSVEVVKGASEEQVLTIDDLAEQKSLIQSEYLGEALMQEESPKVQTENLAGQLTQQESQVQTKNMTNRTMLTSPCFQNSNAIVMTCSSDQIKKELNPTSPCLQPERTETTPLSRTEIGKPALHKIIKEWNIRHSLVEIPRLFCSSYGWNRKQVIMLLDAKGISYNVSFKLSHNHGFFCKGWRNFCMANNVEPGDNCKFILIDKGIMSVKVVKHASKAQKFLTIDDFAFNKTSPQSEKLGEDLVCEESPQVHNEKLAEHHMQRRSQVQIKNVTKSHARKSPRFQNSKLIASACINDQIKNDLITAPVQQLTTRGSLTEMTSGGAKLQMKLRTLPQRHTTRVKPMFVKMITKWSISNNQIFIPLSFCSSTGWNKKQMLILQDEKRRSWRVKFSFYHKRACFSMEWRQFCTANSVKPGDKCIFMLIGKSLVSVKVVKCASGEAYVPEETPEVQDEHLAEHRKSQVQNKVTEGRMRRSPRFQNNNAIAATSSDDQTKKKLNPAPLQLIEKGNSTQFALGGVEHQMKTWNAPWRRSTRCKPMFERIIGKWAVKRNRIYLPVSLCLSYGWKDKQTIILLDARRRSWNVLFTLYVSKRCCFSQEWRSFCIANNVKPRDKCIFTLIGERIMSVKVVKRLSKTQYVTAIDD